VKAAIIAIVCVAIACSASQRTKTLDGIYTTALAAGSAFTTYDGAHQQAIVAAGSDKPTVDAQLATWRATQVRILTAIVAVFQAVDAANKANTDASVAGAVAAGAALIAELQKDGVL
jgi:hypothetical protein